MRSSACVVMATKAVAALLRNKMAGVVSLCLLLLPLLSSFFLISVNWSRLVVTPSSFCPCSVLPSHFAPYSVPPTVHSHFTHVSQQEFVGSFGFFLFCSQLHTVQLLNPLVEITDERGGTQTSSLKLIPIGCGFLSRSQVRNKKEEGWLLKGPSSFKSTAIDTEKVR